MEDVDKYVVDDIYFRRAANSLIRALTSLKKGQPKVARDWIEKARIDLNLALERSTSVFRDTQSRTWKRATTDIIRSLHWIEKASKELGP